MINMRTNRKEDTISGISYVRVFHFNSIRIFPGWVKCLQPSGCRWPYNEYVDSILLLN